MDETTPRTKLKERIGRFWKTWWGWVLLGLVLLTLAIVLAVLASTGVIETGFGAYTPPASAPNAQRARTLWDWMGLLLVPIMLALGAGLFTWVTNKRERDAEDQKAEREQAQQLDWAREVALQSYLDRMTELIGEGLGESQSSTATRSIARARTLTALRQMDGTRKGLLLRFLYESDLVGAAREDEEKPIDAVFDLLGADLTDADLPGAFLCGADLRGVCLSKANLHRVTLSKANLAGAHLSGSVLNEAKLIGAELSGADLGRAYLKEAALGESNLSHANLSGADLCGAYLPLTCLSYADLSGANLHAAYLRAANLMGANLTGANLSEANLTQASLWRTILRGSDLTGADLSECSLSGADLRGAKVTAEQLAQAKSLEGATMPDGTKYTAKRRAVPVAEPLKDAAEPALELDAEEAASSEPEEQPGDVETNEASRDA
jgi:uncharacterized protein YjbI with pentapeptide repeats